MCFVFGSPDVELYFENDRGVGKQHHGHHTKVKSGQVRRASLGIYRREERGENAPTADERAPRAPSNPHPILHVKRAREHERVSRHDEYTRHDRQPFQQLRVLQIHRNLRHRHRHE